MVVAPAGVMVEDGAALTVTEIELEDWVQVPLVTAQVNAPVVFAM